jgi:hypothetical protein
LEAGPNIRAKHSSPKPLLQMESQTPEEQEPAPGSSHSPADAMERLRQIPVFRTLLDLQQEVAPDAAIRRVLSHHTTTSCQPQRTSSPLISLEDAGLSTPLRACPTHGSQQTEHYFYKLTFPSAYSANDGLAFTYQGPPDPSMKKAKSKVCHEVFALMLSCAPDAVHIHPNSVLHGIDAVTRLRDAARQVKRADPHIILLLGDVMGNIATLPENHPPRRSWPAPGSRTTHEPKCADRHTNPGTRTKRSGHSTSVGRKQSGPLEALAIAPICLDGLPR